MSCVNLLLHLIRNFLKILEKKNINLKQENEQLKQENKKLKNYIEKSFQVFRNLFSFPIDRFKRLVDNFVLHFDR